MGKQQIEENKARLSADALKRYNDYRNSGHGILQSKTTEEYLQKVAEEVKAREQRQENYNKLDFGLKTEQSTSLSVVQKVLNKRNPNFTQQLNEQFDKIHEKKN